MTTAPGKDQANAGLIAAAKHLVRRSYEVAGVVTSERRVLPDYLIMGAQRCGTTSLQRLLCQHPTVKAPPFRKGVHYFDLRYQHGLSWYQGHFPLRRPGRDMVCGEASPFYMFHPLAPKRIAGDLPEVRLIVSLRDPVERAFSAYKQEHYRGFEALPFEQALAAEPARIAGERERMLADPDYVSYALQHQAYRARGQYAQQVADLFTLFGRERVHVVDFGDLAESPASAWTPLCDFLGLEPWTPKSFPHGNARPSADMDPAIRSTLQDDFVESDRALAEMLGWKPSWLR